MSASVAESVETRLLTVSHNMDKSLCKAMSVVGCMHVRVSPCDLRPSAVRARLGRACPSTVTDHTRFTTTRLLRT